MNNLVTDKFKKIFVFLRTLFQKLSMREQAFVISRLAFLIGADISLIESLKMLREQAIQKKEKRALDFFITDVSRGIFLSSSIEKIHPPWNHFLISVIRTGEMTGTLYASLQYVAQELKKRQILVQKIIGALLYPFCIAVATVGVTGMIVLYILPKITPIFSSLGAALPFSTRMLLFVYRCVFGYGIYIGCLVFLFIVLFFYLWKKNIKFHRICERIFLRVPIVGTMIQYYEITQTFHMLNVLIKNSMSLEDSLSYVALSSVAIVYSDLYHVCAKNVAHGMRMSVSIRESKLFPPMVAQMLSVGESSGNIVEVSLYVSEYYEQQLDEIIKKLSSMLEPILMVILGVVVGFVAVSVISPIYEITQNIKR